LYLLHGANNEKSGTEKEEGKSKSVQFSLRPRLSRGCGQSRTDDQGLTVAADIPPTTENFAPSFHV